MHLDSRHFDFYNYFSDAVEFKLDFKSLHLALYCLERQIGNDLLTNQRFTRSTNDIIHLEFFDLISIDIECNASNHHGALLFYFTYMVLNREGSEDIIIYAHQLQLCVIRYRIDVCLFNGYQVELHFSETKKLKISFRESFNCLIVLKWNKILSFAMYVMISDFTYLIAVWRERFDSKLQHVRVSKTMAYEVNRRTDMFLDIEVKIYKKFHLMDN